MPVMLVQELLLFDKFNPVNSRYIQQHSTVQFGRIVSAGNQDAIVFRGTLALLRTIGAKKGQLYGSVLFEAVVLGFKMNFKLF